MSATINKDDRYWLEYNNLQRLKHLILQRYLGGWYPILSRYHGKVIYFETHAGRGRHARGQLGSPLVALHTLLHHKAQHQILARAKIGFFLVDNDDASMRQLRQEVHALRPLPDAVNVTFVQEDFESVLDEIIARLDDPDFKLAPAFVFVDPFGFKLPIDKLERLLHQPQCDMLINFMWRYVNLALHNPTAQQQNLDALFGVNNWQDLRRIQNPNERCESAIQRIVQRFASSHHWSVKMLDDKNAIKYVLIHLANHQKAFDLMKDVLWAITPEGSFRVRQSDNPKQEYLIAPEPDLRPLTDLVWDHWDGKRVKLHVTYPLIDQSIYKRKHYHDLLRNWRNDGSCAFSDYEGRFAFEKNPTVEFQARPN